MVIFFNSGGFISYLASKCNYSPVSATNGLDV